MNRRQFIGGSVLAATATPRMVAIAQTATPEVDADPRYISDFANIQGVEAAVTRYAVSPTLGLAAAFAGDLYHVDSYGFKFRTESQAGLAPREIVDAYRDWYTIEHNQRFQGLSEASARQLGDASWGWIAEIPGANDDKKLYPWALFAVRKNATVQMMIGVAISGTPLRRLADISEETLERWPNDDRRYTYGGEPAGGIWDTLPRLDDYEEGMVIEYSSDVSDRF